MKLHLSGLFLLLCLSVFIAPDTNAQERQTQLRGPKNATSQFSGAVYGPIDEQDTLWRIAKQYRQDDSLSMYQVMQAIYELNPNAFEQQNRNLLVEGATLRLPSRRYISRINTDQARGNAETDNTRYSQLIDQPSTPGNNIKSPEPLAKQSELSDTRTAIEQKITKLDEQQIQQFDELRQQFAASLDNVQQMLNENRKLYERVEQVNTDLLSLKQQVEGDVQSQMDEQLALQRELLAMVKQDQSAREAEQQSSFGSALTQPISLIIGSGILTLLLAGGLAAWLLRARNNGQTDSPSAPQADSPLSSSDNMSSTVSQDFDDDTPELTDSELFDDDELLDDVLSSELEDTLDAELDSFADDMLVPDDNDHIFDEGDTELGQDDLDSLFDDEIMDTVELTEDADNIAVSGVEDTDLEDTGLEELEPEKTDHEEAEFDSESDTLPEESPVSEEDFAVNTKDAGTLNEPVSDETDNPVSIAPAAHNGDEQPEISIDELLEAEQAKTQNSFVTNNDVVDDEMLGKLDSEINQQNAELDRLADGILQEIDQIEQMGGLPTAEEIEQEKFESRSGSAQGIQNLDSFADELDDIELNDIDNADNFADPLSDELIAQLQAENEGDEDSSYLSEPEDTSVAGFDDPLSNELLAELSADQSDNEEQLDTLSDELLAELEGNSTSQEPGDIEALPAQDTDPLESDELTDDLLAELEAGISAESDFGDSDDVSNTDDTASDTGKDTNDIDALLDSVAEANDDEDKSVPQSDNDLASDIEPPNVDANSDVENADSDVENANSDVENADSDVENIEKDADSDANVDIDDIDALLDSVSETNDDEVKPESQGDSDLASEVEPSNADAQSDVENADSDVENADSTVENIEKDADSDANVDIDDIDALLDSVPEANDVEDKSEPQSDSDLAPDVEPSNADAESDVEIENADSDVENADSTVENNEKDADSDANVDIDDIDALLDSVAGANDDEDKSQPQSDSDLASEVEPPNADAESDIENADSDVENADSTVENNEKDADSDANVDIDDIDALLDSVAGANDDEDNSEPQSDSDLASEVEPSNADADSDVENVENADSDVKPAEPELPESANNETSSPSEDVSSEGKEDAPPSDLSAMPDEEVEALLGGLSEFDRDEATDPEAYTSDESVGSEFTDHESTAEEVSEHDDSDQKEDTAAESERQENTVSDEELSSDDDALSLEADSERPIVEPPEPSLPSDNFEPEREDEITPSEMAETGLSSDLESAETAADELFDELDLIDENDTDFEGEPSLEFEEDSTELSDAQDDESSQSPQPASEPEPEPERENIPDVQIDPLDSALTEFDRQLMDNIPSFTDSDQSDHSKFDDSILNDFNDAPEFALEQELDGAMPSVEPGRGDINELEDVPGLDDWLSDTKGSDKDIFDELEGADFDDLLGNMGEDSSEPAAVPGASQVSDEAEQRFKQEHPDLDLSALLNDPVQTHEKTTEADFLTVESLLDDSLQDDGKHFEEVPLDLDVSLSDYSGISDDADIIDIDKDAGQSANLDLARVYMEMDDMPTARELLEEVAKKGSEEQQKEAGELLAGLA